MKVRASRTRKEWTNLIVDRKLWEPRHPQDFVKGVIDDQSVSDPRPRATLDTFLGPLQTTTTARVAAGGNLIPLASAVRFLVGDRVEIMLDTNQYFVTIVQIVPSLTSIQILPVLPYSAAAGNIVTNMTAMAAVNIG
jgi:hypothetical protein